MYVFFTEESIRFELMHQVNGGRFSKPMGSATPPTLQLFLHYIILG